MAGGEGGAQGRCWTVKAVNGGNIQVSPQGPKHRSCGTRMRSALGDYADPRTFPPGH